MVALRPTRFLPYHRNQGDGQHALLVRSMRDTLMVMAHLESSSIRPAAFQLIDFRPMAAEVPPSAAQGAEQTDSRQEGWSDTEEQRRAMRIVVQEQATSQAAEKLLNEALEEHDVEIDDEACKALRLAMYRVIRIWAKFAESELDVSEGAWGAASREFLRRRGV